MTVRLSIPVFIFSLIFLGITSCSNQTNSSLLLNTPSIVPPEPSRPGTTQPPTLTTNSTTAPKTSPKASATSTVPICTEKKGKMEQGQLETELLRQPLEYLVYLPPCYDQKRQEQYPVLYLIHGQSYNQDQWDRLGADEAADLLISTGQVEPFIIVMPRDRLWEQPEDDPFGQAVLEVLIPFVDQNYRTLTERRFRAVGGLSRGAGWAVHLGLSNWQLFGAIGAHSLPVFWSDTSRITTWLDAIPHHSLPRIYLDIGEKDRPPILSSAIWFEQLLTRKRIPHEWYLFNGYHEEAYWKSHVEQYLRWYAAGW